MKVGRSEIKSPCLDEFFSCVYSHQSTDKKTIHPLQSQSLELNPNSSSFVHRDQKMGDTQGWKVFDRLRSAWRQHSRLWSALQVHKKAKANDKDTHPQLCLPEWLMMLTTAYIYSPLPVCQRLLQALSVRDKLYACVNECVSHNLHNLARKLLYRWEN